MNRATVDAILKRWLDGMAQLQQGGVFTTRETIENMLDEAIAAWSRDLAAQLDVADLRDVQLTQAVADEQSADDTSVSLTTLFADITALEHMQRILEQMKEDTLQQEIEELEAMAAELEVLQQSYWSLQLTESDLTNQLVALEQDLARYIETDEAGNIIVDNDDPRILLRARMKCLEYAEELQKIATRVSTGKLHSDHPKE